MRTGYSLHGALLWQDIAHDAHVPRAESLTCTPIHPYTEHGGLGRRGPFVGADVEKDCGAKTPEGGEEDAEPARVGGRGCRAALHPTCPRVGSACPGSTGSAHRVTGWRGGWKRLPEGRGRGAGPSVCGYFRWHRVHVVTTAKSNDLILLLVLNGIKPFDSKL